MKEARKRNPSVKTYGLIWGAPGWINNQTGFYGADLLEYQLSWLRCANDTHGVEVDWLGLKELLGVPGVGVCVGPPLMVGDRPV